MTEVPRHAFNESSKIVIWSVLVSFWFPSVRSWFSLVLLILFFCFSFGSDRKKKKVCDKTNAPWDTEWDLRSSHWPKHLLKTPSLPFYRFISSVYRFLSFIPKNRFGLLVLAKLILAHGPWVMGVTFWYRNYKFWIGRPGSSNHPNPHESKRVFHFKAWVSRCTR